MIFFPPRIASSQPLSNKRYLCETLTLKVPSLALRCLWYNPIQFITAYKKILFSANILK